MVRIPRTDRNDSLNERSKIAEGSISNIISAVAKSVLNL